jgi:hypothetical protein
MSFVQSFEHRQKFYEVLADNGLGPLHEEEKPGGPFIGFGDVRRGLLGAKELRVVVCVNSETVVLLLDGVEFDLMDSDNEISRRTIAPFIKRFSVRHQKGLSAQLTYVWFDVMEDEHSGTRDILKFAWELNQSRATLLRFFHVWQRVRAGLVITSQESEAAIARAVESDLAEGRRKS